MGFLIILIVAIIVIMLVAFWKMFTKAGKPGYAALIPNHNVVVLFQIGGKPEWWWFLLLIPIVNFVIIILMWHAVSLSFGKSAGFTVGLILLPVIFIPILGLGNAEYKGPPSKEVQTPQQNQ
ncbi:MAG: DUF5684 domain-containing protein [Bacteroidota bacterium]